MQYFEIPLFCTHDFCGCELRIARHGRPPTATGADGAVITPRSWRRLWGRGARAMPGRPCALRPSVPVVEPLARPLNVRRGAGNGNGVGHGQPERRARGTPQRLSGSDRASGGAGDVRDQGVRPLLQFPEWLDREDALRKSLPEQRERCPCSSETSRSRSFIRSSSTKSAAGYQPRRPTRASRRRRSRNGDNPTRRDVAGSEATPRPVFEKCDFQRLPGCTHRSESMMIDSEGQKACSQAATRFR